MSTETKTERGRTVNIDADFQKAFGHMLDDRFIDIEAPPELLEKNRIIDSAEAHVPLECSRTQGRSRRSAHLCARSFSERYRVALTTSSPSRAVLHPRELGESVPTHVQYGFLGTAWTTTGRGFAL